MAESFRDLLMWQKGIRLSVLVYRMSKRFPREDLYGLTSQMRRAAISVPSNIAEGCGRLNKKEYCQFLGIARGSYYELQTQITIARELGLGIAEELEEADNLSNEVGKMLAASITTLKSQMSNAIATTTNH